MPLQIKPRTACDSTQSRLSTRGRVYLCFRPLGIAARPCRANGPGEISPTVPAVADTLRSFDASLARKDLGLGRLGKALALCRAGSRITDLVTGRRPQAVPGRIGSDDPGFLLTEPVRSLVRQCEELLSCCKKSSPSFTAPTASSFRSFIFRSCIPSGTTARVHKPARFSPGLCFLYRRWSRCCTVAWFCTTD